MKNIQISKKPKQKKFLHFKPKKQIQKLKILRENINKETVISKRTTIIMKKENWIEKILPILLISQKKRRKTINYNNNQKDKMEILNKKNFELDKKKKEGAER